jgi:CRISPR system Cascade subunit CasD
MREYLVFQLYGPLSAWGDIAVGETRPADFAPSKSAVLGLIAAALGLRRPDTTADEGRRRQWEAEHLALAEGYGMAAKITLPGLPLTDYHTVQVPSSGSGRNRRVFATRRDELTWMPRHELNTILSRRDYRQDAFAGIALWAREGAPYPLHTFRDRLQTPEFVLYLGRKSCPPALPLNPGIRTAESIEAALGGYGLAQAVKGVIDDRDLPAIGLHLDESKPILCWDSDAETSLDAEFTVSRRDLPTSRHRWQFAVREEHRAHRGAGDAT